MRIDIVEGIMRRVKSGVIIVYIGELLRRSDIDEVA